MGKPMSRKTTTAPGTFVRSCDDRLVSIATAADYLGVTTKTVRNMILDGRLPARTLGVRVVRIRLSDIDAAHSPYGGAHVAAS
jgi:excisionase family DNA binding protein